MDNFRCWNDISYNHIDDKTKDVVLNSSKRVNIVAMVQPSVILVDVMITSYIIMDIYLYKDGFTSLYKAVISRFIKMCNQTNDI